MSGPKMKYTHDTLMTAIRKWEPLVDKFLDDGMNLPSVLSTAILRGFVDGRSMNSKTAKVIRQAMYDLWTEGQLFYEEDS